MIRRIYDGFLPGQYAIEAYGAGGFRFAELSHRGSLLALPSGMHAWAPLQMKDVTSESFAPVLADADRIDLLLIGTGLDIAGLPEALRQPFRENRVSLDLMPTAAAARTYNVLFAEGRRVAAALLAVA